MSTRSRFAIALGLALGVVTITGAVSPGKAYTETVLYKFCTGGGSCTDGSAPEGAVLKKGNRLYGTTTTGGAHNGGTVYRYNLNNSGYTVLYSFCVTSGCANSPSQNIIMDTSGNLYGVAAGGANGGGEVWELVKPATGSAYTYVALYDFCATMSGSTCTDGNGPDSLTYAGAAGGSDYDGTSLLFGTTGSGGSANDGTVFAMQVAGSTWAEKVIHSFTGTTSDGKGPGAVPWIDGSNNIWGTTGSGGSQNKGAVYELSPTGNLWTAAWTQTIVFNFCWSGIAHCDEGAGPNGIIADGSGNLFGTTITGGTSGTGGGNGIAYELTAGSSCTEGGTATFLCETVLHNFCSAGPNCTDGDFPSNQLVMDSSGTMYGTTALGGGNGIMLGEGTVFSLSGVTLNVIHSFCSTTCPSGQDPGSTLIVDSSGNLYGTTTSGGDATSSAGVLYELSP